MKSSMQFLATLTIGCVLSAPAALAGCNRPPAPSKIPDGSTASIKVMVTTMKTVKEYNNDVQTYLKCLDFEARQNQISSDDQVSLHNEAVNQLQHVTALFNAQVKIYKSKHS